MKKSKYITIILLMSFIVNSCIKKEHINIEKQSENYIQNNTNDTLILKFKLPDYFDTTKVILKPKEIWVLYAVHLEHLLHHTTKIEVYKSTYPNVLFIGFYRDTLPYNYTKDIYNFSNNWKKDTIISKDIIKYLYSFTLSYENCIHY